MNKEEKQNLKRYLELVKKIYDGLSDEEKQRLLLRRDWEKRNKGKTSASQN